MVVKVKLNYKAFRQYRTTEEANALVDSYAEKIKEAAGEGYEVKRAPGKNRARSTVIADTKEALADNQKNLTLLKATGRVAGGG